MILFCTSRCLSAERYRSRQRVQARSNSSSTCSSVRSSQSVEYQPACSSSGCKLAKISSRRALALALALCEPMEAFTEGRISRVGFSPSMSRRSLRDEPNAWPVSANQTAWTWARTRSSLARSMRGGVTAPDTICCGRLKKYWSWGLPVVQ